MLNFILKKIKRYKSKKNESGMTLIEVVIAFVLISIITTVLIQGTSTAVKTLRISKARTESIAVANEKIELIRAMDYNDIDITFENPGWVSENTELLEDGYAITYDVSWVSGETDSYKQLMVTVQKDSINNPIKVVTQIYPTAIITSVLEYPPPEFLEILDDSENGANREIKFEWQAPNTDNVVVGYNIYRDGEKIVDSWLTELYIDNPGSNNVFIYYVTALYDDGTESIKSNEEQTE